MSKPSKILILGASGMLGNAMLRFLAASPGVVVYGTVRSPTARNLFPQGVRDLLIPDVDVENQAQLAAVFERFVPDVVVNCVGLVKQFAQAGDPLAALPINSLLPHRLLRLCRSVGARLIHISTDCVFAGTRGRYKEDDPADARDLYGLSKYLGEVDGPDAVTLRTSLIGPELDSAHGLVGWFLSQQGRVKGYTQAIFSGVPTVEMARVIRDFVLLHPELRGVYHVAAAPISKYDLLCLVARAYDKAIEIEPDGTLVIDRSLDGTRFRQSTGYVAPDWPELVRTMQKFG
jgi:dTDP-4-dehydrorhamnose reductase